MVELTLDSEKIKKAQEDSQYIRDLFAITKTPKPVTKMQEAGFKFYGGLTGIRHARKGSLLK